MAHGSGGKSARGWWGKTMAARTLEGASRNLLSLLVVQAGMSENRRGGGRGEGVGEGGGRRGEGGRGEGRGGRRGIGGREVWGREGE